MTKTILLADDSPTIQKIVELAFSDTGIRVETAASGERALELAERMRPDLVLADVVMPEPAGYELCRQLKELDGDRPVLLLAGTFEPFDAELARECGANGHLVKPFESETLLARVDALLAPPTPPPAPAATTADDQIVEDAMEEAEQGLADQAQAAQPLDSTDATETESTVPEQPVAPQHPSTDEDSENWTEIRLSPEDIDAVAQEVVRRLSERVVREIALELIPEITATIVREQLATRDDPAPEGNS